MKSAATKRLMQEYKDLQNDPCPEFTAAPLEDNILEFHFTIRGPPHGGFQGGRYHGRLIFPPEYPFKAPNIIFLTENGRFEVGQKICLSITAFHQETWHPAWGIRTVLIAVISFFLQPGLGAVGAIDWSEPERAKCAKKSVEYFCPVCGSHNKEALPSDEQAPSMILKPEPELMLTIKKEGDQTPADDADVLKTMAASKQDALSQYKEGNSSKPLETIMASSPENSTPVTTVETKKVTTTIMPALEPKVPPHQNIENHSKLVEIDQDLLTRRQEALRHLWQVDALLFSLVMALISWFVMRVLL